MSAAAEQGVRQSVVILDRASGAVLAEHDPDSSLPALSLVKVLVAADLLDSAAVGTDTLEQIDEMIAASDDVVGSDLYSATGADAMVLRVADRFGLTGTTPTPDGRWWGNVQTTAADMARLLRQVLTDPVASGVIGRVMQASTPIAADGVDQRFGLRVVPGAGVKQGWGCCLSGVLGVHSVGFTADRIVAVLTAAEPQDYTLGSQDGVALQADPGGQISIATVTATVRAAFGGPALPNGPGSPSFMPAG